MNNVSIINVRPNQNSDGAYVTYSAVLKPTDHSINGNFTATDNETKEAFANNQGWNGFKLLVLKRIKEDVDTFENQNQTK